MLLVNEHPVDFFTFSGGELQVRLPDGIHTERVTLTWKPKDVTDFVLLPLTVNALTHAGFYDIDLDVLYLPYARQDRVCHKGEAFSLKMVCEMLNELEVSTIRIWDAHNPEATFNLFDKEKYIFNIEVLDIFRRYKLIKGLHQENLLLCAPDEGALSRVVPVERHYGYNVVHFDKVRDTRTGIIENISLYKFCDSPEGKDVLIIDDICDGGKTFMMAAHHLRSLGAERLYLYVTHGIFSKGLDDLHKYFDAIICHHVLDDERYSNDHRLTILRKFDYANESTARN